MATTNTTFSWESHLTPQEAPYYAKLFQMTSKSNPGIVTGTEAVQFFATSGVPNQILSNIWEATDHENNGYLTPETFSIALKLIACAQNGKQVSQPVLSTVVPLPRFKGIPSPESPVMTRASPAQPPQTLSPAEVITPVEREKYGSIFRAHHPNNGVLDADTAKSIFLKSQLPAETLGQIWQLADIQQNGQLTQPEFAIAMHYIAKLMDSTITTLPTQLPQSVYASAANLPINSPMMRANTMTPPQRSQTIDSLGSMAFSSAAAGQEPGPWDVTAQEKAQYDAFFDKIDTAHTGQVQGKETVEFFKNSKLPEQDLAAIWDLADAGQRGQLSRDEFAVAMHLIHARLKGEPLPSSLPRSLVPPSPHIPANLGSYVHKGSLMDDHELLSDFGDTPRLGQQSINTVQAIKAQHLSAEQTLEQILKQKQEFQAQMSQTRMAHEAEVKDLNELQEKIRLEEPAWNQARQEFEEAQQKLVAVQTEVTNAKQTIEQGRTETETLRKRIAAIQLETATATAELEQLNSQVKQQGMMLDINRRQVTASVQDREQAKRDLEDFKAERGLGDSDDDSDSDEEEKEENRPFPQQTKETTGSPMPSSQFLDMFSPHIDEAESRIQKEAGTTEEQDPNDFDAIFGRFTEPDKPVTPSNNGTPSSMSEFDPFGWSSPSKPTVSPARSTRRPPPPPQSRHAASPAEDRAPAAHTKKQPAPLPQTASQGLFDFDDAFSFEPKDVKGKGKQTDGGYESNSQAWTSGFEVSGFNAPASKEGAPDDWDSIFGTNSPAVAVPTESFGGFDDMFSAPNKGKGRASAETVSSPTTAKSATTKPTANTAPITGGGLGRAEKIEDLVKMGFERQAAKDALDRYDQDLDKATNFLLDQ
ncbi:hypothetical protein CLU79DRAFT_802150 [Phycomyces nitens]|nr:hypothetical protein CLU79DRAFT_802150 [Phycomyces nitens]